VRRFERDVFEALSGAMLRALERAPSRDAAAEETAAHERFRLGLVAHADGTAFFTGRREYLRAIARYVDGEARHALVLHGASGVGKSAVIAQAIGATRTRRQPMTVIHRFAGATPEATNVRTLLASLCAELRSRMPPGGAPGGESYEEVAREFAERIQALAAERPIAVFIDALDQLRDLGDPPRLQWIPQMLPVNVRLVVSTVAGPVLDALKQRVPVRSPVEIRPMPPPEGAALLRGWLRQSGRMLRSAQRVLIEQHFAKNGLPLYLRLAFEEARRWRSYERGTLAQDVPRLLRKLTARLSRPANHGSVLVDRSLGYLTASRDGLADDEVLGLLSRDPEVRADFVRRSPDSPRVKGLPPIVWARFYFDLEPYLATTPSGGTLLLRFYHRQFAEEIARRYSDPGLHGPMARYFAARGVRIGASGDSPPNARTLVELPYQLARAGKAMELRRLLANFDFMQSKVEGLGPRPLLDDYALAAAAAPEAGAPLHSIARELERAAHVLDRDRLQTGGQLLARLLEERTPAAQKLVTAAGAWCDRHWLRPLRASLAITGPLIRTLDTHAEHINGLAVTPSRRFLVSCANEEAVRVWDLRTGAETRTLEGHTEWVKDVAVLPGERHVVSVSFDKTIRIWDLATYAPPQVLKANGRAWSVALFPDGRRCAVGAGRKVQIRDLETRAILAEGKGHSEEVTALAITPDGARVVSLSEDQTVRVWDARSMKKLRVLRGEDADPERWKEMPAGGKQSMHPEWTPYALAVTPDGRHMLAARRDHTIRLRALDTGAEVLKLVGHENTVDSVAVARDGSVVASTGWDRTLRLWSLPSGEPLQTLRYGAAALGPLAFVPDARMVYTGTGDGKILVWSLDSADRSARTGEAHPEHDTPVTAVCATRDQLLSASRDGTILFWDRRSARLVRRLDFEGSVSALAVTPDGRTLFATGIGKYGRKTGRVSIAGQGKFDYVSFMYGGIHDFQQLQVTPDGQRLIGAGLDGTWALSLENGKVGPDLELYTRWIAITPDGRYVLGAYKNEICRVPIEGGRRGTLFSPENEVWRATLLPDGETLACFGLAGHIELWTLGTRARKPKLRLPGAAATGAASGDGRYLITADYRGAQLVWWDLENGAVLARFDGIGPMSNCAIAPDGVTVVAGEETGRVHLIRMETPTS
jgi:WD40 repeat protein